MNRPNSNGYTPEQVDQWLRGWALLINSSSQRLSQVRSDLENAAASLDRNLPGHLAVEMRMKGSTRQEIARALGVSISRGASILRYAQEQMARYLGTDDTAPWWTPATNVPRNDPGTAKPEPPADNQGPSHTS